MSKLDVFIDMDGVLADFHTSAITLLGHDPDMVFRSWPIGEYELNNVLRVDEEKMWERINSDINFWHNLKPYPEAMGVWEGCKLMSASAPIVATSPSKHPNSSHGKVSWLTKWFGSNFRDYVLTPRKFLLANPTRILIDDWDKNIKKWEQHGGIGILYPRPWNNNHYLAADPVSYTMAMLAHHIGG